MIYCIGDSHVCVFSGQDILQPLWPNRSDDKIPFFRTVRIGRPSTAYNLQNKTYLLEEVFSSLCPQKQDYILFVFGEVDCRFHLGFHNNIENCVDRYMQVVVNYNVLYNMVVYGVIASGSDESYVPEIPYMGTCVERNTRTRIFNDFLEQRCDENNIPFISIFKEMLLDDGITDGSLLWDHLHVSQKMMPLLISKLRQKNILSGQI